MRNATTDLTELQLTIQRLVDADLLLEEEAGPLLSEIEALLSTEDADQEAIGRLVDRIARLAVVSSPHLEPADGRNPPATGPDPAP